MTKTLSLLIKNEPALTAAALRFARAIDPGNTRVDCVFFFGKGVHHATGDNRHFWSSWSREIGARLILCSASAETYELTADDDFSVGGLGELIEAGMISDKVVSFG
jgi:sulfur relay (sulfurtransferase) complex TusBCD TusD component (DsrE family)